LATVVEWAEAYREQAAADLRAATQATEPSVLAMLLQMAYEKVAKAALLRAGMSTVHDAQRTHLAASTMMTVLAGSRRKCNQLGVDRWYLQYNLLPMVTALEGLHPALVRARGGAGPWLEYPWEDPAQDIRWPARDLPGLNGFRAQHGGRAAALANTCSALVQRLNQIFV
jgi:hypothetical protein